MSRAFDDALEPPTAACWQERENSVVWCWSVHDSPCPLGTQRQREPLLVEIFFFLNQIFSARPSSTRGASTISRSSPLSLWACLRPAQRHRFWRLLQMRCGSRDGRRGRPRRRAGWGAAASGRVEAAAARWAGRVRAPQSAPKQPRTAGPCSRLRRRRGQSGTQGP